MNPSPAEIFDAAMSTVTIGALVIHSTVFALLLFITFASLDSIEGRVQVSSRNVTPIELVVSIIMLVGTIGIWREVLY